MALVVDPVSDSTKRGREYDGLRFSVLEMVPGTNGQRFNTGNPGLRYVAMGASRLGAPAATTISQSTTGIAIVAPGIVEVQGSIAIGDLLMWFAGSDAGNAPSDASTWNPVAGAQDKWRFYSPQGSPRNGNQYIASIPVRDVTGASNVIDRKNCYAVAYDTRGNVGANTVTLSNIGQTGAANDGEVVVGVAAGTGQAGTSGRVLYWHRDSYRN